MAAHQLTGMLEVISDCQTMGAIALARKLKPAIDFSCWTEGHFDCWNVLVAFCLNAQALDPDCYAESRELTSALRDRLILFLPDVIREWESLGKPDTREQWLSRWGEVHNL